MDPSRNCSDFYFVQCNAYLLLTIRVGTLSSGLLKVTAQIDIMIMVKQLIVTAWGRNVKF